MSDAASKHRIVVEANCTTTAGYGEDNCGAGDLVHEGIDACVPIKDSSIDCPGPWVSGAIVGDANRNAMVAVHYRPCVCRPMQLCS
mmetsp:Transcript_51683/g.121260  ORF Transcript_51683/g.121260 Transcript_51683/m.121260 type:complete len:86 (+) Transcript_51683:35-292(+)